MNPPVASSVLRDAVSSRPTIHASAPVARPLLAAYVSNGLALSGLRLQTMIFAWIALGAAGQGWAGLVIGVPVIVACAGALWGGLLADSPRARLAQPLVRLGLACAAFLSASLAALGLASPPMLLVLSLVFAAMTAIDTPIARSLLFRAAGDRPLLKVTSANAMALNALNIAGPASAGYILGRYGGDAALALLGLLYVASALLSRSYTADAAPATPRSEKLWSQLTAGLAYLRQDRQVGWLVTLVLIVPLAGTFFAAVPVYARDVLHAGPTGFGLLMAFYASGNLAGSAYLASGRRVRRRGRAILVLGLTYGLSMVVFATLANFYACAAVGAMMGAIAMLWQNLLSSTIQLRTPEAVNGRVLSLYTLGIRLLGLGWLINAGVSAVLDVRMALLVAGLAAIALNLVAARKSDLLSVD